MEDKNSLYYISPEKQLAHEIAELNYLLRQGLRDKDRKQRKVTNEEPQQKRKSGRRHLPDDIWAWEQVNKLGLSPAEVLPKWIAREAVKKRNLIDAQRQFDRIIKLGWL